MCELMGKAMLAIGEVINQTTYECCDYEDLVPIANDLIKKWSEDFDIRDANEQGYLMPYVSRKFLEMYKKDSN